MTEPEEEELMEGGDVSGGSGPEFNEKKQRAETARKLACYLVAILAGTIVAQYVFTCVFVWGGKEAGTAALDKLFNSLLPVLSGLVGGAVTYYFTKETQS
jgi:hypothetical protein